MSTYSLIEYKLRRYVFLGHEYNMYVPPQTRHLFWQRKHHDNVTGVRIIGKIVNKNKTEEINSIVPALLKIKQESRLYDDRLLIFALAVCSKFTQCKQMVTDAYNAVTVICTDGLKLLMYVKFCTDVNTILFDEGYLSFKPSGFGNGFRKTISNWYLKKDPLLTTELILRHKCFEGWTHKTVMQLIHIHSDKPQQNIFIVYTACGIEKVKEKFGLLIKNIHTDNINETVENKRLKCIYKYIEKIHYIYTMDENTLRNEIELNRWGQQHEIVPTQMLHNTKILTSLVMHMPLAILLDKTYTFAKLRLFRNSTPYAGLREYISRFNHLQKLKESKIHPIESFIEYVKYSRTSNNIVIIQHNKFKKQGKCNIDDAPNKIKVLMNSNKINMSVTQTENEITMAKEELNTIEPPFSQENELSSTVSLNAKNQNIPQSSNEMELNLNLSSIEKQDTEQFTTKEIKSPKQIDETIEDNKEQNQHQLTGIINQSSCLNIDIQHSNSESNTEVLDEIQSENNQVKNKFGILMLKPLPKLVDELLIFLSEDLVRKTLQNMIPSNRRILISYEGRICMKRINCFHTKLLSVQEAITLIILSLIYPETIDNKPSIYALKEKTHLNININYGQPLTVNSVESVLFNTPIDNSNQGNNLDNMFSINWARQNKKIYDVFVILGTNQMNLKRIKKVVQEYRKFSQKFVKVVVCCLNGKHKEQRNISMGNNMLFIAGFDKNVGKIIDAFINDSF